MHPIDLSQELQTMIDLIDDVKNDAISFLRSDAGWDSYGIYRDKYEDRYLGLASQVEKAFFDQEEKIAQLQAQIEDLTKTAESAPSTIPSMTAETCHRIFMRPIEPPMIMHHYPDVWELLKGGYLQSCVYRDGVAWEIWNCKTAETWNKVADAINEMIDDGRLPQVD